MAVGFGIPERGTLETKDTDPRPVAAAKELINFFESEEHRNDLFFFSDGKDFPLLMLEAGYPNREVDRDQIAAELLLNDTEMNYVFGPRLDAGNEGGHLGLEGTSVALRLRAILPKIESRSAT